MDQRYLGMAEVRGSAILSYVEAGKSRVQSLVNLGAAGAREVRRRRLHLRRVG